MKTALHLFALLLLATPSWAATPESYRINFSAYALRPLNTTELYYKDAPESYTQLEFRKKSRSDFYQATIQTSDTSLQVYRRKLSANNEEQFIPVGHATIPQGNSQWLLLLVQDNTAPDRIRAYAIDDSPSGFPKGSIRLANITGVDTVGKINTTTIEIPNGSSSAAFSGGSREALDISIAAQSSSRYHLLYKNSIRITSGSRGILILTPPVRKGSIRIGGHLLLESPNEIKDAPEL